MLIAADNQPMESGLQVEAFARQLRDAVGERNDVREYRRTGRAGANGGGAVEAEMRRAEARRVATKVGRGMLAATDPETARHADDVVLLAGVICHIVGIRGGERQDVLAAAHLHDIGKAAVPRGMLEKPGPLTEPQWRLMRAHTEVGARILAAVPELDGIARLVRHSHERWDGDGYPDGLSGGRIPLGSRVIFCADAFHAIRADRPYRRGRSASYALAELQANSGTQFDPEVVDALTQAARELRIAPATRRLPRSNRLAALLLCLTVGGSGSAIARTGPLDEPSAASPPGPAVSSAERCEALVCASALERSIEVRSGATKDVGPQVGRPGKANGDDVPTAPAERKGSSVNLTGGGANHGSTSPGHGQGSGQSPPGNAHPLGQSRGEGHPVGPPSGGAPGGAGTAPQPRGGGGTVLPSPGPPSSTPGPGGPPK